MNEFKEGIADTASRTRAERHIESVRQQGGLFVEAVRVTRMPMIVTDATLPGNPITFANAAFLELSGYSIEELLGQEPHFMNGKDTDPEAIVRYQSAIAKGEDETLEIVQYRRDGTPFRAMLFASPLDDGQGAVTSHFLSYLDITRRYEAEESLRLMTAELEARIDSRTEALEAANAALRQADLDRETLLVEVNHRAKNSLAVAASLLVLQGRRQKDAGVTALFSEAAERLMAMARLHDLLSRSEQSQRVDIATYLNELCEAMRSITGGDGRVSLKLETEADIRVDADRAFPIGIILTELITNAVKYAFPAPQEGVILVHARRAGPGRVEVGVRDTGVGMSGSREGSLGYGMIRSLVRQIDGEITIEDEGGVSVTIAFGDASRLSQHPAAEP